MKKYLLAGMLITAFFFQTTAQSTGLKEEVNSPVGERIINDPVITAVSKTESTVTGYNNNGEVHYKSRFKHKMLHGTWTSWYADGTACDSGNLVKGLPDGEWKVWYENGQLRFVRNYKADNYERIQHEINRYNPKTSRFALSALYHKHKELALAKMKGSYGFPANDYAIPSNKLALIAAVNTSDEGVYHPVFEKALLHGVFINYNEDGSIKDSGRYENGLRQGLWTENNVSDNRYSKGWYEKGLRNKQWKTYNTNGDIISIEEYKTGKLVWKKEF